MHSQTSFLLLLCKSILFGFSWKLFMSLIPYGLALTAFAAYSVHDLLIKQLSQSISVIQIVFLSTLFTFPMMSVWLVSRRELKTLRPNHEYAVLFRSVSVVIVMLSAFYAFQQLPKHSVDSPHVLVFRAKTLQVPSLNATGIGVDLSG